MPGNEERRRVIDATMRLAADQGWTALSMQDIARESGVALPRLRARYATKGAILADFIRSIDQAVLTRIEREAAGGEAASPRDRVFDVLMMRLEALEPYKAGLKAIFRDVASTFDGLPELFVTQLNSRRWMLAAAGVRTHGLDGAMKAAGLGLVYGRVLRVWVDEEDPGLPKTMAELDRQLRRGAQTLNRLDGPIAMVGATMRLACSVGQQVLNLGKDYRRARQERRQQRAGEARAAG
ncbi:TetR family transcriptional regulator [Rhodoligotrophos defluvii]|uniref:TetR family transcriptional regulator n=1 Tax=Rhodoligotrophos defluvii TaxID=2561934 RepID=UPI001484DC27|nr:TetR family transcriptional regulator [Rhodoligotrophos defluvii]